MISPYSCERLTDRQLPAPPDLTSYHIPHLVPVGKTNFPMVRQPFPIRIVAHCRKAQYLYETMRNGYILGSPATNTQVKGGIYDGHEVCQTRGNRRSSSAHRS